jgi:hypothetical protein
VAKNSLLLPGIKFYLLASSLYSVAHIFGKESIIPAHTFCSFVLQIKDFLFPLELSQSIGCPKLSENAVFGFNIAITFRNSEGARYR